jgi:hypothetical protein
LCVFRAPLADVEDPVSHLEINRNTILEGVQGNRNPFIDNPAFATAIWGGPQAQNRFDGIVQLDIESPTAPATLFATNTTATGTELTWIQSTDNVGVLDIVFIMDLYKLLHHQQLIMFNQ